MLRIRLSRTGKKGQPSYRIVVTEIPYQVNKANLVANIAMLVREKRINGITDIRDESGRQGMRLVIQIKRNADAHTVLNKLYKFSQLQESFSVNNRALVNGVPKVLNMKEMIQHYSCQMKINLN